MSARPSLLVDVGDMQRVHVWVVDGDSPAPGSVACGAKVEPEVIWHRAVLFGWNPMAYACSRCGEVLQFGKEYLA